MFFPDAMLCLLYVGFNIKVLYILFRNYFFQPGFNTQMKSIIINRRITMTLLIMIYEGPFLLVIFRRGFDIFIKYDNDDWQQYSKSSLAKEFN